MDPKRLTIAAWLCVPLGILGTIAPFYELLPSHATDKSWPAHARFHLTWAAGKLCGLGVNQIMLALIPLRSGQRWSWFALASNFLFGSVSNIVASRIHMGPIGPVARHDKRSKLSVYTMLATILGLALSYWELFGADAKNKRRNLS